MFKKSVLFAAATLMSFPMLAQARSLMQMAIVTQYATEIEFQFVTGAESLYGMLTWENDEIQVDAQTKTVTGKNLKCVQSGAAYRCHFVLTNDGRALPRFHMTREMSRNYGYASQVFEQGEDDFSLVMFSGQAAKVAMDFLRANGRFVSGGYENEFLRCESELGGSEFKCRFLVHSSGAMRAYDGLLIEERR